MAAAVIAPDACANCEWQTAACQRHLAASAASESSRRGTRGERGAGSGRRCRKYLVSASLPLAAMFSTFHRLIVSRCLTLFIGFAFGCVNWNLFKYVFVCYLSLFAFRPAPSPSPSSLHPSSRLLTRCLALLAARCLLAAAMLFQRCCYFCFCFFCRPKHNLVCCPLLLSLYLSHTRSLSLG